MDLLDISGENALQFRFIISDKERRVVWFPHIISALEELKKNKMWDNRPLWRDKELNLTQYDNKKTHHRH